VTAALALFVGAAFRKTPAAAWFLPAVKTFVVKTSVVKTFGAANDAAKAVAPGGFELFAMGRSNWRRRKTSQTSCAAGAWAAKAVAPAGFVCFAMGSNW